MRKSGPSSASKRVEQHLSSPLVSIIILNYNGGKMFLNCLDSVLETDYPYFDVVVVDNGSHDGSIKAARKRFRGAIYIENSANLGFSVGNNVGIEHSQGEYIVLLNNDTIVEGNWLRELMKEVKKRGEGFYNPRILLLDNPKLLDSAGNKLHFSGVGLARGLGEIDEGQYSRAEEVAYANGTCLLVPRKVVEKVGLLDPVFFSYGEDVDWCWRGKLLGIKSYYVPSAVVYHKLGASWGRGTKRKLYLAERNRIIVLLKNYSRRSLILLLPIFFLTEISTLFYAFIRRWLSDKIRSYSESIKLRGYIRQQRRIIQRGRRVTDERVTRLFSDEIKHPYIRSAMIRPMNAFMRFFAHIIHL